MLVEMDEVGDSQQSSILAELGVQKKANKPKPEKKDSQSGAKKSDSSAKAKKSDVAIVAVG